ncbi:MAG: hypothetical protein IIB41_01840 [Candidatus Marinimicrobia bacterium]|nr:hypothetical protein [Candidatus Neomarinimicrobiota bacterium]
MTLAAESLGIERTNLYKKIKKYYISPGKFIFVSIFNHFH